MKTALEYISLKKGIKKVTLTDKSEKIPLFILNLFKYGKSYYQKNFGFKYINKMHQIQQTENMKIKRKLRKNYSNILQKKK